MNAFIRSQRQAAYWLILALASLVFSAAAHATPVAGELHFSGRWAPIDSEGNPLGSDASLAAATGMQFLPLVDGLPLLFPILYADGLFADLAPYVADAEIKKHNVTINTEQFQFALPNPVLLWTAGAVSFVMTSVAHTIVTDEAGQKALKLEASGTVSLDTQTADGRYLFTGGAFGAFGFWSATEVAMPVPTPGPLALIGGTLIAGAALRRRRSH
jgi:hypothetical protein